MRFLLMAPVFACLFAGRVIAQDSPASENEISGLPESTGEQEKASQKKDDSLLPDLELAEGKKQKKISRDKQRVKPPADAQDLSLRIRYRAAKTRALNNPETQAAWDDSRSALTEYDRREALKRYYSTLYKDMLKLDKGIAKLVEERHHFQLRKLIQTRVDPTDPLAGDAIHFRED